MDAGQWQLIRRIFHEAVDLPPGERGDFVSRAAEGDEALRVEVESLLASHDHAASFIEPPGDRQHHSGRHPFGPQALMAVPDGGVDESDLVHGYSRDFTARAAGRA